MKILVIGSGGREHAIIRKLSESKRISHLYCAPGNGGISKLATCVNIKATDIEAVVAFSKSEKIDMVFVAPDDPLALGMVDALEANGIKAFGPRKSAAVLEASKAFSKQLMKEYHIPTASYEIFENIDEAILYLDTQKMPVVIKADGLALGKGVIIAETHEEAVKACQEMMSEHKFGDSGKKIVIEEFMKGKEVTVLAFTDGKTVYPMISSQDHKRAYDNDEGLNTGGMGAFSPSRAYTDKINEICEREIFIPTIKAMEKMGRPFKGVIYFGLMLTDDGPKVVEYNARFGDPETQVILPLLKNDLVDIMEAIIEERLDEITLEWETGACACIVLASGGYPVSYEKGYEIKGIEHAEEMDDVIVFHAGTKEEHGIIVTNGGRVLGVTAKGKDLSSAIARAYQAVEKISFKDMHYRKDIGNK
ncbi:MAG: phosphoribosylamine--glycine ligase [Clostridia bacterium]|nr:phosphoribosylamine--glycine ligase [Clostridia bacterium]